MSASRDCREAKRIGNPVQAAEGNPAEMGRRDGPSCVPKMASAFEHRKREPPVSLSTLAADQRPHGAR